MIVGSTMTNRPNFCTWGAACNFDRQRMVELIIKRSNGLQQASMPWLANSLCLSSSQSETEKTIAERVLYALGRCSFGDDLATEKKGSLEDIRGAQLVYFAVEYMLQVKLMCRKMRCKK